MAGSDRSSTALREATKDALDAAFRAELAALDLDSGPDGFWKERQESLEGFRHELLAALSQGERLPSVPLLREVLEAAAESLRRTDDVLQSVEEHERARLKLEESDRTLAGLRSSLEALRHDER